MKNYMQADFYVHDIERYLLNVRTSYMCTAPHSTSLHIYLLPYTVSKYEGFLMLQNIYYVDFPPTIDYVHRDKIKLHCSVFLLSFYATVRVHVVCLLLVSVAYPTVFRMERKITYRCEFIIFINFSHCFWQNFVIFTFVVDKGNPLASLPAHT